MNDQPQVPVPETGTHTVEPSHGPDTGTHRAEHHLMETQIKPPFQVLLGKLISWTGRDLEHAILEVLARELAILEALTRDPVRKAEMQDISWKAVPSAPCRLTLDRSYCQSLSMGCGRVVPA